ncbi:MAG: PTS system mannose/fructose/sorbose family transporter subunit IID [Desulfovibrionales bacterium]
MTPEYRVLLSCFLRTYLVGANFNTRGMQNIGLSYAIDPGLKALYQSGRPLRRARKRYLQHYNTHPFWTPLLVGFFLFLERKITRGLLPEKSVADVRTTTVYTLSAIGDSFFGGAVLVFWSLTTVFVLLQGSVHWALAWTGLWFFALQVFKMYTFFGGVREGLIFLQRLKHWNLINWGQRLKVVNGFLIVVLWMHVFPLSDPLYWLPMALSICALAWLAAKLYWAREILIIIFAASSMVFAWVF